MIVIYGHFSGDGIVTSVNGFGIYIGDQFVEWIKKMKSI